MNVTEARSGQHRRRALRPVGPRVWPSELKLSLKVGRVMPHRRQK